MSFIYENFFIEEVSKIRFHEIAFFYYIKSGPIIDFIPNSFFEESKTQDYLAWVQLDKMENLSLYPEFFKTMTMLSNHKPYLQHIVTDMGSIKL